MAFWHKKHTKKAVFSGDRWGPGLLSLSKVSWSRFLSAAVLGGSWSWVWCERREPSRALPPGHQVCL